MPTIIVDLPWPPSTNSIWRNVGGRAIKSSTYRKWIKAAQAGWWIQKMQQTREIKGEFNATIILNPPTKRKVDLDNRIKAVLDLAQSLGLIEDDNLCRSLLVEYAGKDHPPDVGARLVLKSW